MKTAGKVIITVRRDRTTMRRIEGKTRSFSLRSWMARTDTTGHFLVTLNRDGSEETRRLRNA